MEHRKMPRILVIDDDDLIRAALRRALECEGYDVVDAQHGKEGIDLFREQGADLIITDIIMPEKDGIETIKEIRRDFPEVGIVAISGGGCIAADHYLALARRSGAQKTFTKPLGSKELLEAVRELLG
jgi:DNA-binding response OmpR family regulator